MLKWSQPEIEIVINVTPQQRENVIDKMEFGDTILNSDVNLPGFESMTEREQMIFVIDHYKKLHDMLRIHINDDSVYDILESDSNNPDYVERLYTYNGEYQELKFK